MPTPIDVLAEYHGNYMTRPERGSGIVHEPEPEPEFNGDEHAKRREREELAYAKIYQKEFEKRIYEECDKEDGIVKWEPDADEAELIHNGDWFGFAAKITRCFNEDREER